MIDNELLERTQRQTATRPPKHWRNRWELEPGCDVIVTHGVPANYDSPLPGVYHGPCVVRSRRTWPDRETAEEKGKQALDRAPIGVHYVDAQPED